MSNRITKQQAAQIAGVHEKTLERYAETEAFQKATGYVKNQLNGRVTFDEQLFREYIGSATGADLENPAEDPGPASLEITSAAPVTVPSVRSDPNPGRDFITALLTPHKIYLTLDEAKALTSFPKTFLRTKAKKIHGRILIKRSVLDKL